MIFILLIAAGLAFSLVGDVLLMLPVDKFRAGLSAFLVAHLLYIIAFLLVTNIVQWWIPAILFFIGAGFIFYIFPSLGSEKVPVMIYIVTILVMLWRAGEILYKDQQIGVVFVFTGALLFAISDLILALNRFQEQFSSARGLNLTTYFAAQLLIACSVGLLAG